MPHLYFSVYFFFPFPFPLPFDSGSASGSGGGGQYLLKSSSSVANSSGRMWSRQCHICCIFLFTSSSPSLFPCPSARVPPPARVRAAVASTCWKTHRLSHTAAAGCGCGGATPPDLCLLVRLALFLLELGARKERKKYGGQRWYDAFIEWTCIAASSADTLQPLNQGMLSFLPRLFHVIYVRIFQKQWYLDLLTSITYSNLAKIIFISSNKSHWFRPRLPRNCGTPHSRTEQTESPCPTVYLQKKQLRLKKTSTSKSAK